MASLCSKIWAWLKTVAKLLKLLPRRRQEETDPAPHLPTDLDKKLGKEIQERQAREGRPINTKHEGPNMPKSQPCRKGYGWKKREDKAIVSGVPGALYYCNVCKTSFFVRAK